MMMVSKMLGMKMIIVLSIIIHVAILSTPEGVTDNSPNLPMTSTPVKKPSARKPLCLFTNILDVNNKTANRLVGSATSKCKAIKYGTTTWALKKIKKGIQKSIIR